MTPTINPPTMGTSGFSGTGRASHGDADAVVIENIGRESDSAQQKDRKRGAAGADDKRDSAEKPGAIVDCKVAERRRA
jgi:hypothetical protein